MNGWPWEPFRDRLAAGRVLRVVNYHSTSPSGAGALRDELTTLSRQFHAINASELDELFATGTWRYDKPPLALVFYEGYANHAAVAAPILDELDLTGWFVIPTAFPGVPPEQQEAFALAHHLGVLEEEVGAERLAMTWDEIRELSRRHVIAAHTATHNSLDRIARQDDIQREIVEPYHAVLAATGAPPPATAFLFGSPVDDHPEIETALRDTGYRYVLTNTKLQRLSAPESA